jgi:hypothetical protein
VVHNLVITTLKTFKLKTFKVFKNKKNKKGYIPIPFGPIFNFKVIVYRFRFRV